MSVRVAAALACVVLTGPALAQQLKPDEAKRFVDGKLFSYSCFEGTVGAGRIQADGSVMGTISMRGTSPVRYVAFPAGTIKVNPDSICASVRGIPMQPCFHVTKTSEHSFRGAISGLGFAYCDFVRRNPRLRIATDNQGPRVLPSAMAAAAQ
jgi:hypothetical protein